MPLENNGTHLQSIIETTTCKKHQASKGVACWVLRRHQGRGTASAICNARARRAGFNGTVTPQKSTRLF